MDLMSTLCCLAPLVLLNEYIMQNVGTQGLLLPATLPHQVDCIVQLHASSVVLIICHPRR